MPTIALHVGQAGNQLGATLWDLLSAQQQQQHSSSSSTSSSASLLLSQEWFGRAPSGAGSSLHDELLRPRCLCIDSEAKVVRHWGGEGQQPAVHMLGKGGGCGNNWSCGYSLALSSTTASARCAWSASDDDTRCIDQVLEGVRREAERDAGVCDFLLLLSLAGGTGSGFGSALLQELADEHPLSTLAAVAVAPGRAGGSDTATQSINCCLALQHLSEHAHAVLLCDNQVLLDQLNNNSAAGGCRSSSRAAGSGSSGAAARGASSSGSRKGAPAPVSGRACLQGVNELAAQALLGLLWPLSEADQLAGRTNIRQLASTVAADPLRKLLEVCHVAAPDAQLPVNVTGAGAGGPWPARLKLLARQLPAYDPFHPAQPVSTSAALLVARGGLCTQPPNSSRGAAARATAGFRAPAAVAGGQHAAGTASSWVSAGGFGGLGGEFNTGSSSSWVSAGGLGGLGGEFNTGSSSSWCAEAALGAICSSWPRWSGGSWDAHVGHSTLPLWDAASGTATGSVTAAVRRSSTGSFLRDVAAKCTRLCDAGAYMHWYQQYGTEPSDIRTAAAALVDLADGYN